MDSLAHCVDTIYQGRRSRNFSFVKDKHNITILAEVHSKRLIINCTDRTYNDVTVIESLGKKLRFYATRELTLS
jgi:choline dehydrogenase